jgi:hypothetical protein
VAKTIMIEEIHVTVLAPQGLRDAEYVAMRRTMNSRPFLAELRHAITDVLRGHPRLDSVRIQLSR